MTIPHPSTAANSKSETEALDGYILVRLNRHDDPDVKKRKQPPEGRKQERITVDQLQPFDNCGLVLGPDVYPGWGWLSLDVDGRHLSGGDDDPAAARRALLRELKRRDVCDWSEVQTGGQHRGYNLLFVVPPDILASIARNTTVHVQGWEIEVRVNGYCLVPPSVVEVPYTWVQAPPPAQELVECMALPADDMQRVYWQSQAARLIDLLTSLGMAVDQAAEGDVDQAAAPIPSTSSEPVSLSTSRKVESVPECVNREDSDTNPPAVPKRQNREDSDTAYRKVVDHPRVARMIAFLEHAYRRTYNRPFPHKHARVPRYIDQKRGLVWYKSIRDPLCRESAPSTKLVGKVDSAGNVVDLYLASHRHADQSARTTFKSLYECIYQFTEGQRKRITDQKERSRMYRRAKHLWANLWTPEAVDLDKRRGEWWHHDSPLGILASTLYGADVERAKLGKSAGTMVTGDYLAKQTGTTPQQARYGRQALELVGLIEQTGKRGNRAVRIRLRFGHDPATIIDRLTEARINPDDPTTWYRAARLLHPRPCVASAELAMVPAVSPPVVADTGPDGIASCDPPQLEGEPDTTATGPEGRHTTPDAFARCSGNRGPCRTPPRL